MDGRHCDGGRGIHAVFELTLCVCPDQWSVCAIDDKEQDSQPHILHYGPKILSLLICIFLCLLCIFSLLYTHQIHLFSTCACI